MPRGVYKRTEENRKNISLSKIGKPSGGKGIPRSTRGKTIPIEVREKIRKTMLGVKHSPERVEKYKLAVPRGENHHFWKGGICTPERIQWLNSQRRVRKKGNGGSHTLEEWQILKSQYHLTCPCCKRAEPEIKLTRDHIIPLSKGGTDNIDNIQPLCGSCNSHKHDKYIKYENTN